MIGLGSDKKLDHFKQFSLLLWLQWIMTLKDKAKRIKVISHPRRSRRLLVLDIYHLLFWESARKEAVSVVGL